MTRYMAPQEYKACKEETRLLNVRLRQVEYDLNLCRPETPNRQGIVRRLLLALDGFLASDDEDDAAMDELIAAREAFGEVR